ncbi:DUF2231 domain-containing protein, partial [Aquifex sp.]
TMVGVFFDLVGFALNRDSLKKAGFWSLVVGVVALWAALFSGEAAEEAVEHFAKAVKAEELLERHETLGKLLPWLFTLVGGLRVYLYLKENRKLFVAYLIVGIVGVVLVGLQGRLGGKMVYEYGVGVKPLMEKAHTYEE